MPSIRRRTISKRKKPFGGGGYKTGNGFPISKGTSGGKKAGIRGAAGSQVLPRDILFAG